MGRKTNNGFAEPSGFGEFLFIDELTKNLLLVFDSN